MSLAAAVVIPLVVLSHVSILLLAKFQRDPPRSRKAFGPQAALAAASKMRAGVYGATTARHRILNSHAQPVAFGLLPLALA